MIQIAMDLMPEDVCMVPERREERTTEGGLDIKGNFDLIKRASDRLVKEGIRVSLFIAPDIIKLKRLSLQECQ